MNRLTTIRQINRVRHYLIFLLLVALYIVWTAKHVRVGLTPLQEEMNQFRNVCRGWQPTTNREIKATINLYEMKYAPEAEIPQNWQDTEALRKFCLPYSFVKFRPSEAMLKGSRVSECNINSHSRSSTTIVSPLSSPPLSPEKDNTVLCSWYPVCLLDPAIDAISKFVNESGVWEESHLIDVKNRLLNAGGHKKVFMLDAGANQGIYTIWAAVLGYRVVSFEANNRLMPLLQRSLSLAGLASRVTMFNNALSHTVGDVTINEESGNIGASSISKTINSSSSSSDESVPVGVIIKKITIDDALPTIIERHRNLGLGYMKIDIESHEAKFFTGGVAFMQYYYPPAFQLEINTISEGRRTWDGCECELFQSIMKKLNYTRTDGFWQPNVTFCQESGTFGESIFERSL